MMNGLTLHSWRSCPAAAFGSRVSGEPSRGFGHDRQAALFTDSEELDTAALLRLVQRGSRPRTFALIRSSRRAGRASAGTPSHLRPFLRWGIGSAQVRAAELSK